MTNMNIFGAQTFMIKINSTQGRNLTHAASTVSVSVDIPAVMATHEAAREGSSITGDVGIVPDE